ncbi:MAG: hypothetical protein ACR2P2_22065 [Nakamurella sp.]
MLAIRALFPAPRQSLPEPAENRSWAGTFVDAAAADRWLDSEEANLNLAVELASGNTADQQTAKFTVIVAEYLDRAEQLPASRTALQDLPAVAGC